MKIPVKDIENFLRKIPKEIKALLFYGPDEGLVAARAELLEQNYNLAGKYKYEQVKANPYLILDSFKTRSLFGENDQMDKLCLIDFSGVSISEALIKLIMDGNYNGLIIITAGDLGTDSSLRKLFEKSINHIAAIPCYVEDQHAVARIITENFKNNNITSEPGLVQQISSCIELGNHALVLKEIEKIILFLGEKKNIKQKDIEEYLEQTGEISFDRLCYQLSLKQISKIEILLEKLQNEGHNLVSIARFISRHFSRIFQVKSLLGQGKSETMAMASLQPPVFFKQVNDFTKSVRIWTKEELTIFLGQLNKLELHAKQNPAFAEIFIRKLFAEIALTKGEIEC